MQRLTRHPDSLPREWQQRKDRVPMAFSCWCCQDTGLIIHRNVKRFLIPDYDVCDVGMVCKRFGCNAAANRQWPIELLDCRANAESCEQIHKTVWQECQEAHVEMQDIRAQIANLSDSMSMPAAEPEVVWTT